MPVNLQVDSDRVAQALGRIFPGCSVTVSHARDTPDYHVTVRDDSHQGAPSKTFIVSRADVACNGPEAVREFAERVRRWLEARDGDRFELGPAGAPSGSVKQRAHASALAEPCGTVSLGVYR